VTLAAISRERQIERAWAIVEPDRGAAKVPIRARRAVVAFKASIAGDADALKKAYSSPAFRRLMADFTKPGTLGRDQRLAPIREALAPSVVERAGSAILVTWMAPHASLNVVDPEYASFGQAGCVVSTAYAAARGRFRSSKFPTTASAERFSERPASTCGRRSSRRPAPISAPTGPTSRPPGGR
jgi:hypothetical protein